MVEPDQLEAFCAAVEESGNDAEPYRAAAEALVAETPAAEEIPIEEMGEIAKRFPYMEGAPTYIEEDEMGLITASYGEEGEIDCVYNPESNIKHIYLNTPDPKKIVKLIKPTELEAFYAELQLLGRSESEITRLRAAAENSSLEEKST